MNVLFVNGNPNHGGDSIKLHRFKEELIKLGVGVDFTKETDGNWKRYDIIHSFNFTQSWTQEAYENAKLHNKPFVVSTIFFSHEYQDGHREMLENSHLVCYSEKEVDEIETVSDVNVKYRIIPDGVDDRFYSTNRRRDIDLLFVGGVHHLKQPLIVAKIGSLLNKNVTIVGGDHFQRRYWNMCNDEGATMLGEIPHGGIHEIYRRAKVVVQPSVFDAFPNTVLEGGLAGCQVVLTDNTYCNLKNVYYCDPHEHDKLVYAVEAALVQKKPLQQEIKNNFKWNDRARQLKEYYEDIVRS